MDITHLVAGWVACCKVFTPRVNSGGGSMYQSEHLRSTSPSGRHISGSQPQVRDEVALSGIRQLDGKTRDDRRAKALARVYRYLLARAAEIEATEIQTQSIAAVSEAEV